MSGWGCWGDAPPCVHLMALRAVIEQHGLSVYSELGTDPAGWVNVHCPACSRTYEVTLQEPWVS